MRTLRDLWRRMWSDRQKAAFVIFSLVTVWMVWSVSSQQHELEAQNRRQDATVRRVEVVAAGSAFGNCAAINTGYLTIQGVLAVFMSAPQSAPARTPEQDAALRAVIAQVDRLLAPRDCSQILARLAPDEQATVTSSSTLPLLPSTLLPPTILPPGS